MPTPSLQRRPSDPKAAKPEESVTGGASVDAPAATPPLTRAVRDGKADVAKQLIEESGRPCLPCEMRDPKHKATPIAWAAYNNDVDSLKSLIAAKADLEAGNRHGCTAMNLAGGMGHAECLKLLIEAGANVNSVNSFGHSPLTLSAAYAKPESTAVLIEGGADRYHRENKGRNSMELATADLEDEERGAGAKKVVELLAEAESFGLEAMKQLTAAMKAADLVAISSLLEGPRGRLLLEQRDKFGNTPLVLAAWQGRVAVIELLLRSKALIDARNGQGATPLATAAQYGKEDAVRTLLAAGADAAAKDPRGRTPLDVARARGGESLIALLEAPPPPRAEAAEPPAIAALEESLNNVQLD